MTNLERIQSMDVDELTDWLMKQIWPEITRYNKNTYMIRWHAVRNYLLMDADEGDIDD